MIAQFMLQLLCDLRSTTVLKFNQFLYEPKFSFTTIFIHLRDDTIKNNLTEAFKAPLQKNALSIKMCSVSASLGLLKEQNS